MRALVIAALITQAPTATACPTDAPAVLAREAHRAKVWDRSWAIAFGVLTVAPLVAAEARWVPFKAFDDDAKHGLWVSAGESAIGAIAHLVMPLRVSHDPDPCRALAETGKRERFAFFLDHAGGLAVGLGGMVLLGTVFHTWSQGVQSFALGYPVALLEEYTLPRHVWHLVRSANFTGVAVSGTF